MRVRSGLATATALWLAATHGSPVGAAVATAGVEPATVARGETATLRVTVPGRVPDDRVHHYMIWTQQAVPNPLRIEGANHVSAASRFHSDDAPEADLLVYYDMSGHRMYTLRSPAARPPELQPGWHPDRLHAGPEPRAVAARLGGRERRSAAGRLQPAGR